MWAVASLLLLSCGFHAPVGTVQRHTEQRSSQEVWASAAMGAIQSPRTTGCRPPATLSATDDSQLRELAEHKGRKIHCSPPNCTAGGAIRESYQVGSWFPLGESVCKTGSQISDEHHENSSRIAAISTKTEIAALGSRKKRSNLPQLSVVDIKIFYLIQKIYY